MTLIFSNTWSDLAGIHALDDSFEQSRTAILRERFAKEEFDKVRRLLEYTKVFNNEMIIRNSCRVPSDTASGNDSPFRTLPEIVLLHIFQYARPHNYQREYLVAKRDGIGEAPRSYPKHHTKDPSLTAQRDSAFGELIEQQELAEASGNRPADALMCQRKRSIDRISGSVCRKNWSTMPIPRVNSTARRVSLDWQGSKPGDNGAHAQPRTRNQPRSGRHAMDLIDSLQRPGWRFSTTLLNPDTTMTVPSYRAFRRYVGSFPGWTTKRFVATKQEREAFGIEKKRNNAYILKIFYQNPGTPQYPAG